MIQKNIPGKVARKVMNAGYEWHAWTVNNIASAKKLSILGIDSITTDRPQGASENWSSWTPVLWATRLVS